MPGLDPGILFHGSKKDGRVKPGHGETLEMKNPQSFARST
jgi:hypothetical protein